MSNPSRRVTVDLLREWPLPAPGDSKHARGDVVVIGGAARSPGAAMLSGLAALRVGSGRITLAVEEDVAVQVAVAIPECGVIPLRGAELAPAASDIAAADAVLLGPGLDDPRVAGGMIRQLLDLVDPDCAVVLDAFALGVLPHVDGREALRGRLVLTPNKQELALLLEHDFDELDEAVREAAAAYGAVVTCYGVVAHPDGAMWTIDEGGPGLATSGSGDVLAGGISGLCARGASPEQAAVWATWLHAAAGEKLVPLGYLARELLEMLPGLLAEASRGTADGTGEQQSKLS